MSRRADPEKLYVAHRAGVQRRLMGTGMPEDRADAWIAAWEKETAGREDLGRGGRYWDAGWNWIAVEREKRGRPES